MQHRADYFPRVSIYMSMHYHARIHIFRKQEELSQHALPLVEVETGAGPWEWFRNKGNSTTFQKYIFPWLIAIHGFGFAKKFKDTDQITEMIVALCTEHKFLKSITTMTSEQAANDYPIRVALLDIAKKAKEASSKPFILEINCLACLNIIA